MSVSSLDSEIAIPVTVVYDADTGEILSIRHERLGNIPNAAIPMRERRAIADEVAEAMRDTN